MHAIGGLKAAMAESMLIFAPNANSYRRFRRNSYAPVSASWGINNRTVALRIPGGPGVRFESMLYAGYTVPPFYDSLLAKLVVHAETREAAITRLVRALSETRIDGLRTTKPLFLALAEDPSVQANAVHTRWLEGWLETHSTRLVPDLEP